VAPTPHRVAAPDTDGVLTPHNLADADLKTAQARFSPLDRL
jgi:hypothetical protein